MALSCIEIYSCIDNVQIRCLYVRKNNVYITKSFKKCCTTIFSVPLLCWDGHSLAWRKNFVSDFKKMNNTYQKKTCLDNSSVIFSSEYYKIQS